MIVDSHIHYRPLSLFAKKEMDKADLLMNDLNHFLEMMEKAGVDRLLLTTPMAGEGSPEECRLSNDHLAEAQAKHPDRFIGIGQILFRSGKEMEIEAERVVRELRLKGLMFNWPSTEFMIEDERLFFIYEIAERHNLPVLVHPAITSPFDYLPLKGFQLNRTCGRELDMTIAVVRLINGGVLKKFPGLNVVISHCGGAISSLKGRIRMYQDRSAWQDSAVMTSFEEFDRLFDRLYFDTAGHGGWLTIVKSALLSMKAERLLFGTEYPKEMLTPAAVTEFIHGIAGLDLSEKDKQGILGENAARLLKLH